MALLIAGAGIAAVGAITSVVSGMSAAGAQRKAEQLKDGIAQMQNARARTQQIREMNAKRAMVIQSGANQGAGQSSSVQSGAAGVVAQGQQNLSFLQGQSVIGAGISKLNQQAVNDQGIGEIGSGLASIGGLMMGHSDDISKGIQTIFSNPGQSPASEHQFSIFS